MRVRIIEKIYHHTNSPTLSTPYRRQREEYWIRKLGTALPYGCNDNVSTIGNLSSPGCQSVRVMNLFNSSQRRKRSHGHRHNNSQIPHNVSFDSLLELFKNKLGLHHVRTKLYSLPLTKLRYLHEKCLKNTYSNTYSLENRLNSIILDISYFRLFKPVTATQNDSEHRSFLKLKYINKGLDMINLVNILHHKKVVSKIPNYFKDQTIPQISYSYTHCIAPKIFNYKSVLKEIDLDADKNAPTCSCSNDSPFIHNPVGHIITGDLNIISNKLLQDVLLKGPKYREPKSFSWKQNFKIIMDSVETYARKWVKRESAEPDALSEWIKEIRYYLKRKIYFVSKSKTTKYTSIFNNPSVKKCLNKIHDKYVVVPADKAPNNIIFICKSYYIQCLMKELGLFGNNANETYRRTTFSKQEILLNHASFMVSKNITNPINDKELPYLYWLPKLHKYPYKQRYIAGSSKCSTKNLSKILTVILSKIKEGLHSYCDTIYSRSGINHMWILKNSKSLVENLKNCSQTKIKSLKSYDFSTLYTTIPHSKLKKRLSNLIQKAFFTNNGKRKYSN